jgi:hypothetical protein
VEPQEELGARVIGTFRDVQRPDRFVWIREFADMAARLAALSGFYGGPVWKEHRDAANARMIDSDDVLLPEPVGGRVSTGDACRCGGGAVGALARTPGGADGGGPRAGRYRGHLLGPSDLGGIDAEEAAAGAGFSELPHVHPTGVDHWPSRGDRPHCRRQMSALTARQVGRQENGWAGRR